MVYRFVRQFCFAVTVALVLLPARAPALRISSLYSPRNRERPKRERTEYIILHTTEGAKASALRKLRKNGEAHYLVDREGRVYRIVHRSRLAYHAGRSMWSGERNLDTCSIGIETVGYHNRELTEAQYAALRELLAELQGIYRIPDRNVLTHCMVAYGTPNRWHKRSHRGRKRCAMNLSTHTARVRLGLTEAPAFDPDVRSGRLAEADPHLAKVLYGSRDERRAAVEQFSTAEANVIAAGRSAWDIARDRYDSPDTRYRLPDGRTLRGSEVRDWRALPAGTRVLLSADYCDNAADTVRKIGVHGGTAREIAGEDAGDERTIYFLPDGQVRTGAELSAAQIAALPAGTRVLVGFVHGGYITARRSAYDVCGPLWDAATTFYRLPDKRIVSGDRMDEGKIPKGAMVFFQR